MKLPKYTLRTLFVLVTLAGLLMIWVNTQLNWIRQRHQFYAIYQVNRTMHGTHLHLPPVCPWSLRLFGERPRDFLDVPEERMAEAKRLFPEAIVSRAFLMVGEKWPHDDLFSAN
jgi:hypothetical protein